MKLTKTKKIFIGLLTLWPITYMLIFMFAIFSMIFMATQGFQNSPPKIFFIIFTLHLFTILYSFGLIAFYVYYIFKTDNVPKDKKVLWTVIIFLGNMFAMPVFWFLYIWREPKINNA